MELGNFTIGPRIDVKKLFFNRTAVESAVAKMEHRTLSRAGAYVMTRARRSIRNRKRAAKPGQPPSNRTGILRGGILFAFEPLSRGVVIGPVRLNKPGLQPALHEFGGTQAAVRSKLIRGAKGDYFIHKGQAERYAPRPYMRPALEAEAVKFPDLFKGALTGPGA